MPAVEVQKQTDASVGKSSQFTGRDAQKLNSEAAVEFGSSQNFSWVAPVWVVIVLQL